MTTINERLQILRKALNMNQSEFGEYVGIKRAAISDIERGRRAVTDRHIKAIILAPDLNVSEEWLRTGDGDMFLPISKEAELAKLTADIFRDPEDSFRRRFVHMLAALTPEDWKRIEKLMDMLTEENKKAPD